MASAARQQGDRLAVHHVRSSPSYKAALQEIATELGVSESVLLRLAAVHLAKNSPAVPSELADRLEQAHAQLAVSVSGRAVALLAMPATTTAVEEAPRADSERSEEA